MVRHKQTKEYNYARFKCYYCNCYNEVKWEKDKKEKRIIQCWNCKKFFSSREIKLNILAEYEKLDDPNEREINRSVNITDYGY